MKTRRRTSQSGITLIEMLVVVTIIALFAALVIPKFFGKVDVARRTAAHAQINAFMTALGAYKLDTGTFPATEQGLQALRIKPENMPQWSGPYLPQDVPMDPWGHPYLYKYPGDHGDEPDLVSLGADGQAGGEGINADILSWSNQKQRQRGITLLELLIVMTLIALVMGLSYPSAAAGLDSMRLRSTGDTVANFLNAAIDRAGRRQQVIEVWISPKDNLLIARSPDLEFNRKLEIPDVFRIVSVRPPAEVNPDEPRRFLLYPGGTIPAIGVEIASKSGRRRMVSIDPITASPHSELEP